MSSSSFGRSVLGVVIACASAASMAASVPTLQGRDLDGNFANGFEAYFDSALNITWLADAGAFTGTWDAATVWAAGLNVSGTTGWRLPTIRPLNGANFQYDYSPSGSTDVGHNITSTQSELAHLFHVTLGNKSFYDATGKIQAGSGLQNTAPFSGFQPNNYWYGTMYVAQPETAWFFDADGGGQNRTSLSRALSAWAVHDGDVGVAAAVPEPESWALALAGVVVAGRAVRRRA
jgi:PEP-CTERM motif